MGRTADEQTGEMTWATTREDRRRLLRCGMCGAASGAECGPGFFHTGRRFEVALCWPGRALGGPCPGLLDGVCTATVESTYLWDFDTPGRHDVATRQAIVYRGACVGCGWAADGAHCADEFSAIADALDHALAGWRNVPIVKRHHRDANATQVARWAHDITLLYEALGLEAVLSPEHGGVIRTSRVGGGTRSHWSRGFYDVCGEVLAQDPGRRGGPLADRVEEQLGLF